MLKGEKDNQAFRLPITRFQPRQAFDRGAAGGMGCGVAGADSLGLCGGWDKQDVERYEAIAEECGTPLAGGPQKKSADPYRPARF